MILIPSVHQPPVHSEGAKHKCPRRDWGGGENPIAPSTTRITRPRKYDFQNLSGRFNFKRKKQQQRKEDGCPAEGCNTVNQYWTWSSCLKITANFLNVFPNWKIHSHLEAIIHNFQEYHGCLLPQYSKYPSFNPLSHPSKTDSLARLWMRFTYPSVNVRYLTGEYFSCTKYRKYL